MVPARLAFFFGAYFFAGGAALSYWAVWLKDRGVGDAEIGTIYMARQFVTVAATIAAGWLAQRLAGTRGLMLALLAGGLAMIVAYEFSWGFWPNLVVTMIWGAMWHPVLSLGDGNAVAVTRAGGIDYARVRMWGSVTFIVGALAAGVAVDRWGPPWVLYLLGLGVALTIPAVALLPMPAAKTASAERGTARARDLLRNPSFALFLVASGFCQASHAVLYSFGTLSWRDAGIDDVVISLLWGESVLVEIGLFMVGGALTVRFGAVGMLALGAGGALVRWAAMPWFGTEVAALVALQALHALTFGATHLAAMAFLRQAVPTHAMPLAQSLYYGLASGLVIAVVFQLSGALYARFGGDAFFAMAALAGVSLLATIALSRRWNGAPLI
ncbi:MAG: MFS transporter [Rhodospirillales bacterium]|nr:MAG: MFS transporter [Rhodospirillales bacterium]